METGNKVIKTHQLVDEAFESISASPQHLSIQLGLNGLSFCVRNNGKYLLLKNYNFSRIYSWKALADTVEKIILEENLGGKKYQAIDVALVHQKFSLVPSPLFDQHKEKVYLQVNAEIEASETLSNNILKTIDAHNVFTIPLPIEKMLRRNFGSARISHHTSILIEAFMNIYKNIPGPQLLVNLNNGSFDVVLISDNKLRFCNSFVYHSDEDVAYFLLFSCEQLKLNPEKINVAISGELEKENPLFELLQKHIRNLNFIGRTTNFSYSYKFDEIPGHFFFSLLNQ